jgi:hypothetical protein
MIPYLIIIKTKKEKKVIYNDNPQILCDDFVEYVINNKIIVTFFHNIDFDIRVILPHLKKINKIINKIKVISRDDSIYGIEFKVKECVFTFKCSYRLLPESLEKLALDLNLGREKSRFPHELIKKEILYKTIQYNGSEFNIKEKAIEYCTNDVEILYEIIIIFSNALKQYKLDIFNNKVYSVSSLSLKIFTK